jgi:hypothetical protein
MLLHLVLSLVLGSHCRIHLFSLMVSDEVAWEDNDKSGEYPSEAEIIVSRGGRTNWAWCLIRDAGEPYTFRHFLEGC